MRRPVADRSSRTVRETWVGRRVSADCARDDRISSAPHIELSTRRGRAHGMRWRDQQSCKSPRCPSQPPLPGGGVVLGTVLQERANRRVMVRERQQALRRSGQRSVNELREVRGDVDIDAKAKEHRVAASESQSSCEQNRVASASAGRSTLDTRVLKWPFWPIISCCSSSSSAS